MQNSRKIRLKLTPPSRKEKNNHTDLIAIFSIITLNSKSQVVDEGINIHNLIFIDSELDSIGE